MTGTTTEQVQLVDLSGQPLAVVSALNARGNAQAINDPATQALLAKIWLELVRISGVGQIRR